MPEPEFNEPVKIKPIIIFNIDQPFINQAVAFRLGLDALADSRARCAHVAISSRDLPLTDITSQPYSLIRPEAYLGQDKYAFATYYPQKNPIYNAEPLPMGSAVGAVVNILQTITPAVFTEPNAHVYYIDAAANANNNEFAAGLKLRLEGMPVSVSTYTLVTGTQDDTQQEYLGGSILKGASQLADLLTKIQAAYSRLNAAQK
jgi:hypothetical protein